MTRTWANISNSTRVDITVSWTKSILPMYEWCDAYETAGCYRASAAPVGAGFVCHSFLFEHEQDAIMFGLRW